MGHPHAGGRETENEAPHARTACGAPEKAKADASPHANGRKSSARWGPRFVARMETHRRTSWG
jgi:hypothetical protein